ncbi:MAG TPA: TauD/TfdA family dioxygenase [Jatrophihabitans sp.]|nr:TauD/TfdA family dioxygenase [Jatrophihabitans sp.]
MTSVTGGTGAASAGTLPPIRTSDREARLAGGEPAPAPPWFEEVPSDGPVWPRVARQLSDHGVAGLRLPAPLGAQDFLDFGRRLGRPIPESDPAIAEFVEHDVLLNLRGESRSAAVALAPFTTGELTLHTEGSRRPADRQPRYIVLMCLEPGLAAGAQTLLVPASAVLAALAPAAAETLRHTRERVVAGTPTVLRDQDGAQVFSFRDLGDEPFHWESTAGEEAVTVALTALIEACYTVSPLYGVRWQRGDLLVIDNHRWFHGRSRGRRSAGDRIRHLQRLRVAGA